MSLWHRLKHGEWRMHSTSAWSESMGSESAEAIMGWQVTSDFHAKQGRSTGRVVVNDGEFTVYLKRHWNLTWWRRCLALVHPKGAWTPAAMEWNHLKWAQEAGFRVPEPLSMGQRVGPGFNLLSYLVIRELTGMLPLHQAIPLAYSSMPTVIFLNWKHQLIAQLAEITQRLHRLNHFHRDLYLCHFYLPAPGSHDQMPKPLTLIDFHRMEHHRWMSWRWQIKDLAQLSFSMMGVSGLNEADRRLLNHAYLGTDRLSFAQRCFAEAVLLKAHRYARHNHVKVVSPANPLPRLQRSGEAA